MKHQRNPWVSDAILQASCTTNLDACFHGAFPNYQREKALIGAIQLQLLM